jgi:predicted MFS family arabinose efflux permease
MRSSFLRALKHLKGPNRPIYGLILVCLLAHITMSGGRIGGSLYTLHSGHSQAMAGICYSLFSLFPALFSLQMGRLIDRVGGRVVMRVSLVVMVAGLLLPSVWPALTTVFVMAVLGGLGFGSFMLAANVAVSHLMRDRPSERVGMLAWLQMGTSLSAVVGPSMTGLMIDGFGFRWAFALMAAIVCVSFITSRHLVIPDVPDGPAQSPGTGLLLEVFRTPSLLRVYVLAMAVSLAWDAFAFMTPVFGHARGFSATVIGLVMSAFACGTFSIRASLPWLSRRWTEWQLLAVAFAVIAAVFCLFPWISHRLGLAALGYVFGLAVGLGQPVILSLIYAAIPEHRQGEGSGLRSSMGNCMGLTGPSVFGAVTAWVGAIPVFIGLAALMCAASWQARRAWRSRSVSG